MTVERGLAGKRKIIIQGEGDESNGGYDQNISCPCMRLSKDQNIKKVCYSKINKNQGTYPKACHRKG